MKRPLVIAILAKSVEHILPLYLKAIESQTEIDEKTIFYIRTNDNRDRTAEILREWKEKMEVKHEVFFDDSSVSESIKNEPNHHWYYERFKILGEIRQKSIQFAIDRGADYFVADCDNIILPHTIQSLRMLNLPVVAPILRNVNTNSIYANYHSEIDENGYYLEGEKYGKIFSGEYKGVLDVPVVHCTYLIRNEFLKFVSYDDMSGRYEYVIFSDSLRKVGIPQYIDNRGFYGALFFSSDQKGFEDELEFNDAKIILESYKK
jgi:hypothetical protein